LLLFCGKQEQALIMSEALLNNIETNFLKSPFLNIFKKLTIKNKLAISNRISLGGQCLFPSVNQTMHIKQMYTPALLCFPKRKKILPSN
jgi:hypothetical protein